MTEVIHRSDLAVACGQCLVFDIPFDALTGGGNCPLCGNGYCVIESDGNPAPHPVMRDMWRQWSDADQTEAWRREDEMDDAAEGGAR